MNSVTKYYCSVYDFLMDYNILHDYSGVFWINV